MFTCGALIQTSYDGMLMNIWRGNLNYQIWVNFFHFSCGNQRMHFGAESILMNLVDRLKACVCK